MSGREGECQGFPCSYLLSTETRSATTPGQLTHEKQPLLYFRAVLLSYSCVGLMNEREVCGVESHMLKHPRQVLDESGI